MKSYIFNLTGHLRCYMHWTALICKHDFNTNATICAMWTENSSSVTIVTVMRHLQASCVYVSLVIAWLVCLWSFWNSISFTCAYWGLKRLTFDFKESSCRLLWVSFHEQDNQRTEILICDDMLIYSLELLHWPWTRDRLCVLIQCLPEVSHPSEFYIDSAITFKAKNVPHSQENNSERLLQKRSIIWTPWRHTCIHIQGCVLMHKQRPHTYSHTQYQQWLSFFFKPGEQESDCIQAAVASPDLWEFQLPRRKKTLLTRCFIAIILPCQIRLLTFT